MEKYSSRIFKVLRVTEIDVYDSVGAWGISNFIIVPKVGETWCVVTKYGQFHLAFRVE